MWQVDPFLEGVLAYDRVTTLLLWPCHIGKLSHCGSRSRYHNSFHAPTHAGVMIVYLIIIADMLVGAAPDWNGVLPTLFGRHDGVWFLSRPFVV